MEEFDLYGDLELLHAQEKQEATEDLKWKDKYAVALSTIQKLQAEKKELNKKIKQLEINFASLFETARVEIKRKDTEICQLRKQRDDICFRRTKPQNAGKQFNNNTDVRRAASSESVQVNPFSGQPIRKKSEQLSDDKLPSTFKNENLKSDKAKIYREHGPRNGSHEKDQSRDRHRDRSKDRSRQRNRSRDRVDERSRHRSDDRNEIKHRDRLKERKSNRSRERSNHRDERNKDKKRKRHGRDRSETKSSDINWDKIEITDSDYPPINEDKNKTSSNRYEPAKLEEKPRDICKSNSDHTKDQTNDLKTELKQLKNVPSSLNEKQINSKIEILQIEILKDVKELKKNKLKAEKMPKPDPIDPAKVAIEKSNQLLEALFDDSLMNKSEEPNDDVYDNLLVFTQQTDSIPPDDNKKENFIKKDENCNLNLQTPQRQSVTKILDDLFGPSPASSLCTIEENSVKSVGESCRDCDFVPIMKPAKSQKDELTQLSITPKMPVVIDDNCTQNDKTINNECFEMKPPKNPVSVEKNEKGILDDDSSVTFKQTDLYADMKKFAKIDENFNIKHQTPQKQQAKKFLDDLFGPSPGDSFSGKKNSGTSLDESSSELYFEPIIKPLSSRSSRIDEETQAPTPSKIPIVIDDSSTDNDISINEECQKMEEARQPAALSSAEEKLTENIVNDAKTFKFVELDSSFYSSEDEINDDLKNNLNTSRIEVESPPFENITPVKNIQAIETESTKSYSEEKSTVLHKSADEKFFELKCAQSTNEEIPLEKCRGTSKNKSKTDDFEKNRNHPSFPENQKQSRSVYHSSERSKERKELCKNDHSEKRSNSSKHNTNSYNSNSMPALVEYHHRSSSSRSEKEKHRRHHHHQHHHHKHRSKESAHTKSDSSSHRSSRKHSKNNRHEIETKHRYSKDKPNSKGLKTDDDLVKDLPRNQKIRDQDQIFFLHCDDISDDDEIFGEESYTDEYKIESNDDDLPNMEGQNLNKNVIEIEESEITNEVESNKRDMDALEFTDKPLAHENSAEIDKETEYAILSLESELKEKVLTLHLLNVATETSNSRIDENPTNTVCGSVDLENENTPMCDIELETNKSTNLYASGYVNATGGLGDQQFSEEYHLQNSKKSSEKENDIIEIQSIENVEIKKVNLDDSEEQENSELQKSESYKDDQITLESLNKVDLHERSQDIQSLCSLEVDSKGQQKHEIEEKVQLPNSMDSLHSSSHHVELNKNGNVPNKVQSSIEENDAFALLNGDKIEKIHSSNGSDDTSLNNVDRKRQVLDNKKPISDENLEASLQEDLNSDNSSNCELVVRKPITPSYDEFPVELSPLPKGEHCETISHDISCQHLNKPSDTSPKKTVASSTTNENEEMPSQITENIPACSTKTNQNLSHSTILFSPHVSSEKSLNSADELESSHSNSDSVLSGRRKKIKTPRKHTHACKNTPNRTMTTVSNRYVKHDEVQTPILVTESNLTSSEILPELFSPDRDLKDATKLTHYTEPEVLVSSPRLVQKKSLLLDTKDHVKKGRSEEKQNSRDNKISLEELNGGFENGKEKATDKIPREEQKPIDENKPEFPSKELRYDLKTQKRSNSSLSSSLSEELSQQDEKQGQSTEEPALSISKTNEIPLSFPSKTLLNEDQQNRNSQIDEDCLQTSSSTTYADQVENIKNVSSISSDKTEELHENTELLKEAEKEPAPKAVSPQTSYALPRSELKRIEYKEDAGKEKSVESYSITLKRNRNKKRNIKNSTEIVETMSNEEVNDTSKTAFVGESLEVQIHNLTIEEKHTKETTGAANHDYVEKSNNEESDKTCSSSIANKNSLKSPTLTLENTKQQQMMEHFNNSEHQLVRTSVINSDEVVDTKPEETNVKKRKRKSNMSLDSSDCEFKNKEIESSPISEPAKVYVKRRYKKKTTQILDSSNSNEDVEVIYGSISEELKMVSIDDDTTQKELKAMEDFKSPDSKEPTKKRKHMKKNSKSSSDSTNKSNELLCSTSHIESTMSIREESKIVSNYDDEAMEHFKSPDAEEPSKKRKHKQKNSNSSSDSTNKSNELCENLDDHDENPSSPSHIESAMSISEESKIVSNYDDEAMEHCKSPDSKELTKKRKHKKKKLNSSFESTNKSNELCGNLERRDENPSSQSHIESAMSISEESKIVPNDDDEAMEHFKSPDAEEPSKKRKHKKKNSNSCLDSTNKSNELFESLEGSENPSSPSQIEFTSSSEIILESLDGILHSSNQSTVQSLEKSSNNFPDKNLEEFCVDTKVTCVNNSLSGEEKEHDSYIIKPKKAKRQRKRKLSGSLDAKSEDAIVQPKKSKNTLENTSQASLKTCDATSCPALGKNHRESINQLQPSPSNETTVSIELTPTHHKIFLNDVFPNDPPPVYKANDDDLQYHEIDDRLRSMFQSPSYTQPSNEECTFDNKNDNIHPTSNENVEVDEILNQSESTQFDTSASLRKVSLGSNEYVIQSVGSHTANVFITRKKCKKRTKVVTSAV